MIITKQNETKKAKLPILKTGGYSEATAFTVSGNPAGMDITFNPVQTSGPNNLDLYATIYTGSSVAPGTYTLTFHGNPAPKQSRSFNVQVLAPNATTTVPPTTQAPTTTLPPTTQAPTTTRPPTTQAPTTTKPPFRSTLDFNYSETRSPRTFDFYANAWVSEGHVIDYSWNFGDGSIGYGQNVSHTYGSNGTYNVTLTARFSVGGSSTVMRQVTVFYMTTTQAPTTTKPPVLYRELTVSRLIKGSVANVYNEAVAGNNYPVPQVTNPYISSSTPVIYLANRGEGSRTYMEFTNLVDIPYGYRLTGADLEMPVVDFAPLFAASAKTYTGGNIQAMLEIKLKRVMYSGAVPYIFHDGSKASQETMIGTFPFKNAYDSGSSGPVSGAVATHRFSLLGVMPNITDYTSSPTLSAAIGHIDTYDFSTVNLRTLYTLPMVMINMGMYVDTTRTKIRLTFSA